MSVCRDISMGFMVMVVPPQASRRANPSYVATKPSYLSQALFDLSHELSREEMELRDREDGEGR